MTLPENKPVHVVCPHCGDRQRFPAALADKIADCPRCGNPLAAPAARAGQGSPEKGEGDYELDEPGNLAPPVRSPQVTRWTNSPRPVPLTAPVPPRPPVPPSPPRGRAERDSAPSDEEQFGDRGQFGDEEQFGTTAEPVEIPSAWPLPPAAVLLVDVLRYPFRASVIPHWGLISLGGFLIYLLSGMAASNLGDQDAVVGLFLPLLASGLALFWLLPVCSFFFRIVESSSDGESHLPEADHRHWIEQFAEAGYLGAALLFASLPVIVAGFCLRVPAHALIPETLVSQWIFFPVALLSAMESGSPALPFSRPIARSLFKAVRGWMAFYLQSGLLVLAGWLLIRTLSGGDAADGLFLVFGLMLLAVYYFRMLGRLAWHAADRLSTTELVGGEDEPQAVSRGNQAGGAASSFS